MSDDSIAELRATYRRLSDHDLADLHALGPGALRSREAWQVLDDEFRLRGSAITELEAAAADRHHKAQSLESAASALITRYAPFPLRLLQGSLDLLLSLLFCYTVVSALLALPLDRDILEALALPLFFLAFLGSTLLVEWRTGTSPGMALFKLQVVTPAGERPDLPRLAVRSVLRPFGLFGFIFYALVHTPWGHDALSGTRVVRRLQNMQPN